MYTDCKIQELFLRKELNLQFKGAYKNHQYQRKSGRIELPIVTQRLRKQTSHVGIHVAINFGVPYEMTRRVAWTDVIKAFTKQHISDILYKTGSIEFPSHSATVATFRSISSI